MTQEETLDLNIDGIMNDINGKADKDLTNCTKPYIVETYKDGSNWYRVYSDGWCEQGGAETGNSTITFLKPFTDTTYNISFGITYTDLSAYTPTVQATSKTTSNMTISTRVNGSGVSYLTYDWQARGYIS